MKYKNNVMTKMVGKVTKGGMKTGKRMTGKK